MGVLVIVGKVMKAYMRGVMEQLAVWGEFPNGPYEREEYKKGDYAFVGAGALVSKENSEDVYVLGFHDLVGMLLNNGENDFGLEGPQGVALILMVNRIIEDRDEQGHVRSQGVMVKEGEIVIEGGPQFTLVVYPPLHCYHWKAQGSDVPSTNLEYILSVMLFSPSFMEVFKPTIGAFLLNVLNDKEEVDSIMEQLDVIHQNVLVYKERSVH